MSNGFWSTKKMDQLMAMILDSYANNTGFWSIFKMDLLEKPDFQKPNARLVHFCGWSTKKMDQTNSKISNAYGTKIGPFTKIKMDQLFSNKIKKLRRSIFSPLRGRGKLDLSLPPRGTGLQESRPDKQNENGPFL